MLWAFETELVCAEYPLVVLVASGIPRETTGPVRVVPLRAGTSRFRLL